LLPLFQAHEFDPVEFFGSVEEVRRMLAARGHGRVFGKVDE
jgi:hypothetical protein